MPPKLVVFDLDGTLADSHEAIVRSFQHALDETGLPAASRQEITGLIGLPLVEMFSLVAPGTNPATREAAVISYKDVYVAMDREYGTVFTDVIAVVHALHREGMRLAIATSKSQKGVDRIAHEAGITDCFEILVSNDTVSRPKPDPEMLEIIMGNTGCDTGVMVGDSIYDIEMGRRAGFQTIGVTWGSHDAERLKAAGATYIAETAQELEAILHEA